MSMQGRGHSGTLTREISEREINHGHLAKEIAVEGMVLLKNEEILPMDITTSVALFGGGAVHTIKGGTGSGDVNNRKSVSIYQGMKEKGAVLVNSKWLEEYNEYYCKARNKWKERVLEAASHVENPFDAYAANPFILPQGREIIKADVQGADIAVYVISRVSGEGKDRHKTEGDYYLSDRELRDLFYLNESRIPIILILNTGGPVELTDILEKMEYIKAVLSVSQPGQEGGHAVADVLFGSVSPGGRLTATWARRYEDYPYANSFGYLDGNLESAEYRDGIYVGYRYFDSFDIKPLFPFGYGLSYTSFEYAYSELCIRNHEIEVAVTVQNSGTRFAGREVIQLYLTFPKEGEEKEYHRLVGFGKTRCLLPGESQKLIIHIEQKQMASFSEAERGWVVEKGAYGVWMGEHSGSLQLVALLNVPQRAIIEHTYPICPRQEIFPELGIENKGESKKIDLSGLAGEQGVCEHIFLAGKEKVEKHTSPMKAEQPVKDLISLLYGNITPGASTLGSSGRRVPGSAGETTEALEKKYAIRSLIMADGPAGLRLRQNYEVNREDDSVYSASVLGSLENGFLEQEKCYENTDIYYQYCTAFPIGTMLAQTWDEELSKRFGEAIAVEMKEFHVDLWLAPGMNIQRNPLCGRNFEYYSEDPLLSGVIAAAVTTGVQSREGCGVTIKHFACNNQEDNRMNVDVRVSERALREIYLRGFEIAVKRSAPMAVMTAYNRINGIHAANSKDLCTILARKEWGFDGVIMSDWNTTVPEDGSVPWKCIAAGNDVIMPGNTEDDQNIREAYEKGMLTEDDIRSSAGRIIELVHKLSSVLTDQI